MELFISFSEIFRFFKRHLWKFAVVVAACGILFGVLSLKTFKREYTATSTILIACTIDDNASPDYSNQYASMLNVRLQAAIALADSEEMRQSVAERAGVEDSSLIGVAAKQVGTSTLIEVTITTDDRANAALLADSAAGQIAEEIETIYPTPPVQVHITNHAEEPAELSARSAAVKSGILGLVLGFILSLCAGIAILLLDRSIRNAAYVTKTLSLPCLGSFAAKTAKEDDEFRRLRAAVACQVGESGSILLAPVKGKRGAGHAAAGLARALTLTGRTVLLIEADFTGRSEAASLGAQDTKGLAAALANGVSAKEAAVPTKQEGLFFLASGQTPGSSADLLASQAFASFLRQAAESYDYVLCTLPSEDKLPDADSAAPAADSVVLVAEYGVTPYRDFEDSLARLRTAGGKVSGFVLEGIR